MRKLGQGVATAAAPGPSRVIPSPTSHFIHIMTDATAEVYNLKLLLIGNSSVGKSSLLSRFADEQWLPEDESTATIGMSHLTMRLCPLTVLAH